MSWSWLRSLASPHARRLPRALRDEDGQALVELALVILVLMTLLLGGLEIGRALNAWTTVAQASREAARAGAVHCTLDPGCAVVVEARVVDSLIGLPLEQARWVIDNGPYVSGDGFRVRVEFDYTPVTPFVAALIPDGMLTVVGETTMRLE